MIKRVAAFFAMLLGAWLLLCGCSAPSNTPSGNEGTEPQKVTQLIAVATDYEYIYNAVKSTHVTVRADHEGPYLAPDGSSFQQEKMVAFAHLTEQDTYVRLQCQKSNNSNTLPSFTYTPENTVEDVVIYVAYCPHGGDCMMGEGDLVSAGVRVKCKNEIVTTPEQFKQLITKKDEKTQLSPSIVLGADIDLGGEKWTPVDYNGATLWGMGHTVSNFKVVMTEGTNFGFFGTLTGTVRDLHITNATVTARGGGSNVGILAGTVKKTATQKGGKAITEHVGVILNVTVNGTVNAPYYNNVGGVVGCNEGALLIDCKNYAVVNGKDYVGGVVGNCVINDDKEVDLLAADCLKNCANAGVIGGKSFVGGVAGTLTTGTASVVLTELVNDGSVSGTTAVGGVLGYVKAIDTLKELVNNGEVNGAAIGNKVGGVVGVTEGVKSILSCQNKADISGGTYVGGICGHAPGALLRSEGVENNNTVTGYSYVGGFAGYVGAVEAAVNNGTVTTTGISSDGVAMLGGVVGSCGSAIGCVNNADVITTMKGSFVGGIAGKIEMQASEKLDGNKNNGAVSGVGKCVGGIAGYVGTAAGGNSVYVIADNENRGMISGAENVGGFFGEINATAYISIIMLTNMGEVTATGNYAGGIVGKATRLSQLKFCQNKGDITGSHYVGGLAGSAAGTNIKMGEAVNYSTISGIAYLGSIAGVAGVIEDAENSGEIVSLGVPTSCDAYVGGIAGYCTALFNCKNNSNITVAGKGNFVGGLAGVAAVSTDGAVFNCINNGVITSGGDCVGGIAGRLTSPAPTGKATSVYTMSNNTNNAAVTGNTMVGGIFGHVYGTSARLQGANYYKKFVVTLCANNADITGTGYVGGIVGAQQQLTNAGTLSDTNNTSWGECLGTAPAA